MRSGDTLADALGRTVRYSRCTRRERQAISRLGVLSTVPSGAALAREGEPGREFVVVLTGGATVFSNGRAVSALLAGDHLGDVALLHDGISPATVRAATPMTLAVFGPAEFRTLLDRCPSIARVVLDTPAAGRRAA